MRLIALLLMTLGLHAAETQRIVSTAPSITETLFAIGLGPRVVGVTIYCKFPEAAVKLPKIGTYLKPDVEAIVALHPDLVVVQKQSNHLSEELARLHIRYVEVQSENLNAVYAGAREMGKATGKQVNAERWVREMQSQLASLKQRSSALPKQSVAFIVGHNGGTLEGLIAGSGRSYFSDLLEFAGATNIFSDTVVAYPKVSLEEIIRRNPDAIIELSGDTQQKQSDVLALWKTWGSIKAVKTEHVYAVPSSPFVVPGPRAVDAVNLLVRLLHPEMQP